MAAAVQQPNLFAPHPPIMEDGQPKFNDLVRQTANPDAHERNQKLIKAAGIITCVAAAAIAVVAFVLVSIYAPAFIPGALIGGSILVAISINLYKELWAPWALHEEDQRIEDVALAQRLLGWGTQNYQAVLQTERAILDEMRIQPNELHQQLPQGITEDQMKMKTLLARLIYYKAQSTDQRALIKVNERAIQEAKNKQVAAQRVLRQNYTPETRKAYAAAARDVLVKIAQRNQASQKAARYDMLIAAILLFMNDPTNQTSLAKLVDPLGEKEHDIGIFEVGRRAFQGHPGFILPNGEFVTYREALQIPHVDLAQRLYAATVEANGRAPA